MDDPADQIQAPQSPVKKPVSARSLANLRPYVKGVSGNPSGVAKREPVIAQWAPIALRDVDAELVQCLGGQLRDLRRAQEDRDLTLPEQDRWYKLAVLVADVQYKRGSLLVEALKIERLTEAQRTVLIQQFGGQVPVTRLADK